jgi:hypothetical protein
MEFELFFVRKIAAIKTQEPGIVLWKTICIITNLTYAQVEYIQKQQFIFK